MPENVNLFMESIMTYPARTFVGMTITCLIGLVIATILYILITTTKNHIGNLPSFQTSLRGAYLIVGILIGMIVSFIGAGLSVIE
jgi:hypothetical protein